MKTSERHLEPPMDDNKLVRILAIHFQTHPRGGHDQSLIIKLMLFQRQSYPQQIHSRFAFKELGNRRFNLTLESR